MRRSALNAPEVLDAVRAYVAASDDGVFEMTLRDYQGVAALAGLDVTLAGPALWEQDRAWRTFAGQVMRAFGRLAAQGELRKAASGSAGPDGQHLRRNETRFYTPAAWDSRAEQAARRQDASTRLREHQAGLAARMAALGVIAHPGDDGTLRLDPDGCARLITLAEEGARQPGMASVTDS